jgi:hypothetical protein
MSAMLAIVVAVYWRLARSEESEVAARFGPGWRDDDSSEEFVLPVDPPSFVNVELIRLRAATGRDLEVRYAQLMIQRYRPSALHAGHRFGQSPIPGCM